MISVVDEQWLQSVVVEETTMTQPLQTAFPSEQLRLYRTHTPFPIEWLTSQEQTIYSTFTHPKRQASWLLGRTLLKFLACQHPDLVPHGVENPLNTVATWHFPHPQCSVSHTETTGYALVNLNAQTQGSIGLDVEAIGRKPLSKKVLAYLLSETERLDFERLQRAHPQARWDLRYWTAKEALYKATPLQHQATLSLNAWVVQLANEGVVQLASVQTQTRQKLSGRVLHHRTPPVTHSLEGSCSISVAFV